MDFLSQEFVESVKSIRDKNVVKSMYDDFVAGFIRSYLTWHRREFGVPAVYVAGDRGHLKLFEVAHDFFELLSCVEVPVKKFVSEGGRVIMATISKETLKRLVTKHPCTARELHHQYVMEYEPFAALDKVEAVLTELVTEQKFLSAKREDGMTIYYRDRG